MPLIELVDVTKTFRSGELDVEVLHGVSLKIYPGEFLAIMGASGSGKTTLMNILGCLDRPTTGTYRFMGEDVSGFERDELARLRREAFGFVFQSYNLIGTASALENVEVPAVYSGMPPRDRSARARALLGSLGLGERLAHRPSQLSGGQQQRVSIARALMNGGRIVLADEPTGALDSKSGTEVMALLQDLSRRGHTVILITHAVDIAGQAQRIIEIRDGRIVSDPGPQLSVRVRQPAAPDVGQPQDEGGASLARRRARGGEDRGAGAARQSVSHGAHAARHRDRRRPRSSRCSPSATGPSRSCSIASARWARTCCSSARARRSAEASAGPSPHWCRRTPR